MKRIKSSICVLLTLVFVISGGLKVFAVNDLDEAVNDTAKYICDTVPKPVIGSIGGEWAVMGLARSGCTVPEGYFEGYYSTLESYVKECGGVLDERKYTEYSRVVLALTAIGKNPADVAGYNLLAPLGDYDKVTIQGINGPIWALIALDSGGYNLPQQVRERYVDYILARQLPDGGWSLVSDAFAEADPDITAMALQALSKYQSREEVRTATDRALECLSILQNENGGFEGWSQGNCESSAQVAVALCALGIKPDDPRFVKNGKTVLDNLFTYYERSNGFKHISGDSEPNEAATEQAFYALVAIKRNAEGKNSLYNMSDAMTANTDAELPSLSFDFGTTETAILSKACMTVILLLGGRR